MNPDQGADADVNNQYIKQEYCTCGNCISRAQANHNTYHETQQLYLEPSQQVQQYVYQDYNHQSAEPQTQSHPFFQEPPPSYSASINNNNSSIDSIITNDHHHLQQQHQAQLEVYHNQVELMTAEEPIYSEPVENINEEDEDDLLNGSVEEK